MTRHRKKQEHKTHNQDKNESLAIETEVINMTELVDKDFKRAIQVYIQI